MTVTPGAAACPDGGEGPVPGRLGRADPARRAAGAGEVGDPSVHATADSAWCGGDEVYSHPRVDGRGAWWDEACDSSDPGPGEWPDSDDTSGDGDGDGGEPGWALDASQRVVWEELAAAATGPVGAGTAVVVEALTRSW